MLADDTMEVLPINTRNSGRDKVQKLLKKTKVMMPFPGLESLASTYSKASLGEGEGGGGTSRASSPTSTMSGSNYVKAVPSRPYHWTDLHIGDMLPVASMNVVLVDVDEFTREFYQSKRMPLAPPIVQEVVEYKRTKPTTPPHTGFGSEADSLTSCKGSLIPPVPHKDGAKQKLYQGMVLRFCASVENPKPADKTRCFIIQIFLEDDTLQIIEPPSRNSGHKGGVFLSRSDLKPLLPQDVFVGTTVSIHNHRFVVTDADEYTMHYMDENVGVWSQSSLSLIVRAMSARKEVLTRLILTTPGLSSLEVALDAVDDLFRRAGLSLVRQQVATVFRTLDLRRTGLVKLTKVLKFLLDR